MNHNLDEILNLNFTFIFLKIKKKNVKKKPKGAIKNGQFTDTDNIEYTEHRVDKKREQNHRKSKG